MKTIKNNVCKFVHEVDCKERKMSIGHRYELGVQIHQGWFCSGCNRLMLSGKMFKYLLDCPREEVAMKIGHEKRSL